VGKKAESAFQEEPTLHVPFSTDDTVPAEKLQQLGGFTDSLNQQFLIVFPAEHCQELRNLLHNPHLRSLLQQIDVAMNAQSTMMAAMQEPLFVEFANACLQVVEPMTDAEKAELELCS